MTSVSHWTTVLVRQGVSEHAICATAAIVQLMWPHHESAVAWSNNSMHESDVTADAGRHDSCVADFDRHTNFGGPHHESEVAWRNNSTHEAVITADASIISNTSNLLDLATVASLFQSDIRSIQASPYLPTITIRLQP
jgi:hypothetical protein